jgi:predicted RecA/RadA family phage recombinase
MATNLIQDGKILRLTVGSGIKSGNPVSVGNGLHGVALTDYESGDAKASIQMEGVFDLSVQAVNDAGNSAVAVGDRLYYAGSATPWLSKKASGKFFGIALETVGTGETATINVLIVPAVAVDKASHTIIAAGIHTVDDNPLAASEFISVTGCLATDIVLATLHTNTGSPDLYIIGATAAASPAGITITASGTFTAGDKINYAVLRAAV